VPNIFLIKTNNMSKLTEYFKSSYDELVNKVTWPTWSELQESTIIVMIASLIIALIIYVVDIAGSGALGFFYQLFQ
jgi:preprotein translocase subunit SecE